MSVCAAADCTPEHYERPDHAEHSATSAVQSASAARPHEEPVHPSKDYEARQRGDYQDALRCGTLNLLYIVELCRVGSYCSVGVFFVLVKCTGLFRKIGRLSMTPTGRSLNYQPAEC